MWPFRWDDIFTLANALCGTVELVKKADKDKQKYSGYGIGLDNQGVFSLSNGSQFSNVIFFGTDMSFSVQFNYNKKDILIIGKEPTDRLDDTILTAEKEYSIIFTDHDKNYCLLLHYRAANSYVFVNYVEIIKYQVKNTEINVTPSCLGNVSKEFLVDNMKIHYKVCYKEMK